MGSARKGCDCVLQDEESLDLKAQKEPDDLQMQLPRRELVLKRLLAAHEVWFDVRRNFELDGRTFPGFAEFHEQGERYVLTKRAKLWEVSNDEYIFFDTVDRLDESALAQDISYMKTSGLSLVDPNKPNRMSSDLSLVVIADTIDEGVDRAVRKVKFRKNFKFGITGWSDLRVAVVDLGTGNVGQVVTNAAGKRLRSVLEANLAPSTLS